MKKLLILLTIAVVAGLSLNSCLKEAKAPEPGYDVTQTGVNSTQLMEVPLDVYLQADRAIRFQRDSIIAKHINQSTFSFNIGYINLTVAPADTVTYPKTVTVDFGTDTSRIYTGKMILKLTGNMMLSGSKCQITYVNLMTGKSQITGNDSILSSGKNSSGSFVSRYNMNGGHLVGYGNKNINYSGRVIAKYNPSTGVNVMDSVEVNATDANQVVYKLFSIPNYKLSIVYDCNYFNTGVIYSDIKINNILTGHMEFDYGYNPAGYTNSCDSNGIIYTYSITNTKYYQQYAFYAKKFQ